jgi:hypothetical protein
VSELLRDDEWLDVSAAKYTRILQISREQCREKLKLMLEEIREDLKAVDPLEDEIDRRNAAYSRSSTEIIKAYIEPDSTVAGKIGLVINALYSGESEIRSRLAHGLYRIGFLSPNTVTLRRPRDEGDFTAAVPKVDLEALDQNEREFIERGIRRLSIKKIGAWLDRHGGKDRALIPGELVTEEDSYIRFIYALLFGDSQRDDFAYSIEENASIAPDEAFVRAADYVVPDVRFRRGKKEEHESGY